MRCWTLPPVTLVAGGLDAVARAQLVDVVGVVMPVANTLAVSRAAAVPDEVMRRRRGHWAAGVREQREKHAAPKSAVTPKSSIDLPEVDSGQLSLPVS